MDVGLVAIFIVFVSVLREGDSADVSCSLPLGMESGAILDHQLSATTSQNVLREPRNGRLHRYYGDGGWYPSSQDDSQYLTIDLLHPTRLTGVATQGAVSGGYAHTYKLEYSKDGSNWEIYKEDGRTKIFEGNSDSNQVKRNDFPQPVDNVLKVRFNPTEFDDLGMRVELYGCYTDLSLANFNGASYLQYNAHNGYVLRTEKEYITFRFRTNEPDGILLHGFGTTGDYLLFQLLDSKLVVTLNLGNSHVSDGESRIEGGHLLDDDHWHIVAFKRSGHDLSLKVDGTMVTNRTNGPYEVLDIDQQLYIGGTEFPTRPELLTSEMFKGCMQRVLMSNQLEESSLSLALDFIAEAKRGVKEQLVVIGDVTYDCRGTSPVSVTFPSRGAHFVWPMQGASRNTFKLRFQFRTFERNAFMIYNRLTLSGGGMILVGLRNSYLVVVISKHNEPVFEYPAGNDLNDGLWHDVQVDISSGTILVSIDGTPSSINRDITFLGSIYYHFGGTTSLTTAETFDLPGFRGCMREIYIDEIKVDLSKTLTSEIRGVSAVEIEVDSCGLQDWCSPNPCEHNGQCTPEWGSFQCTCTGGYTGATCHTSRREQLCSEVRSTGGFIIDPDGSGPLEAITVECQVDVSGDEQDIVWTVIGHDAENDEDVPEGSTDPGSFTREISYNDVSMDHLTYIIDHSQYCEQSVSYMCNSAKLLNSPAGEPFGWWVDREDREVYSWGGAAINSRKCACGMTGECSDPNRFCNCDADSTNGEVDEGVLIEKERLPVTKLQFGDVGAGSSASFHLGKLRCHGDAGLDDVVTFRNEESHLRFPVKLTNEGALDLSFQFKTTVGRAVLVSGEGHDRTFFQVEIHNPSEIILRYGFGAGETLISHQSEEHLNDDAWRRVRFSLDKKELTLQVDSEGKLTKELNSGHREFEMKSDLFVGTTPIQTEGFVGCIRKLQVNGKVHNLKKASEWAQEVVPGCSGHCSVTPCLFGGKCIEGYKDFSCDCSPTHAEGQNCAKEVGAEMGVSSSIDYSLPVSLRQASEEDNITLGFTTSSGSGVLFRIQNDGTRYQQITLESGALSYKYKLTEGLESSLTVSQHNFADDRHHFVHVVRTETQVTLKVDEYPLQMNTIEAVSFTPSRLIVGAAINGAQNFMGCISRVQFNSTSVNISPVKLYFGDKPSDMRGSGPITTSQCHVHNIPPPLLTKEPPPFPPTEAPTSPTGAAGAGPQLAPGDKATIAIVIILFLLALLILVFLITRYMHRHKGELLPPPPDF